MISKSVDNRKRTAFEFDPSKMVKEKKPGIEHPENLKVDQSKEKKLKIEHSEKVMEMRRCTKKGESISITSKNGAIQENGKGTKKTLLRGENALMCHQCQRNDKGRVVRCENCNTKRFCVTCMTRWFMEMEAAVGGETELVNGLGLNVDKENEIVDTGVLQANGTPEDPPKVESLRPAVLGEKKHVAVTGNKASKRLVWLPNTKGMKDGGVRNGEATVSGNVKAVLSKSISFPAKSVPASSLRKSTTFVKPKKTKVKNSGQNGSEGANAGGLPAKQTNLAALSIARRSLHVKSMSVDETTNGTTSEALQLVIHCSRLMNVFGIQGINFYNFARG